MEKQIYDELQELFQVIIFDNSKSMNQKAKEILEIYLIFESKLKNICYGPLRKFNEEQMLILIEGFLKTAFDEKNDFRKLDFLKEHVESMAKGIVILKAKEEIEKVVSRKINAMKYENMNEKEAKKLKKFVDRCETMEKIRENFEMENQVKWFKILATILLFLTIVMGIIFVWGAYYPKCVGLPKESGMKEVCLYNDGVISYEVLKDNQEK